MSEISKEELEGARQAYEQALETLRSSEQGSKEEYDEAKNAFVNLRRAFREQEIIAGRRPSGMSIAIEEGT